MNSLFDRQSCGLQLCIMGRQLVHLQSDVTELQSSKDSGKAEEGAVSSQADSCLVSSRPLAVGSSSTHC